MKVNFKIQKGEAKKVFEVKIIEEDKASEDSDVYAKITELTKYGNLTIEFSKQMETDMNITKFSSENAELGHGRALNISDDFFSNLMTLYVVPDG